ncbi:hypothetical protein CPT_Mater195 [Bacillus phage Mater]|uniref:Uncharacterized protein n=1 Tax=Bacillus phage Mater TaxID=1540090 RepID=A0A0A0RMY1_9CAUD|nr:hypothetical protein CPT_Mater195 [Bacillus phage Mater]AIW03352.1 hypothetical protein CPT_Mater195 [Bacillus phage Mater]
MFGLTEQELASYRSMAQNFAIEEVTPKVVTGTEILAPIVKKGEKITADMQFVSKLVTDIETIITLTAVDMSYEYAHLQCDSDMTEEAIIDFLHKSFEDRVITQMISYGVVASSDAAVAIVKEIILELPYMYVAAIEDEELDEDEFLEERLAAYNTYIDTHFADDKELEDEDEEVEEDLDD